jgi:tetratricopeptide (TPR) repeat protein
MRTLVILVVLLSAPLAACLWDSDTLEEERRQFPSVLELITGKFLRHSPAFYEWRIADRMKRLEQEPSNVALYDDLAVAYEKTGQTDLAIETMLKKEEISPGLYETYANLGTFYIHAGRLEEGLKEIEKSIEINPYAHFGREVYQKLLVEYVLSKKADGKLELPMSSDPDGVDTVYGFGFFVLESRYSEGGWSEEEVLSEEVEKATKGILGMMRFGNYDSPVLLEALSDLMRLRSGEKEAKRLATRALLQASYVSTDPKQKAAYRERAKNALGMQTRSDGSHVEVPLEEVETQFLEELDEASAWYEDVSTLESSWIADGLNPEIEFTRQYSKPPSQSKRELSASPARQANASLPWIPGEIGLVLLGLFCLSVLGNIYFAFRRRATVGTDDSSGLN